MRAGEACVMILLTRSMIHCSFKTRQMLFTVLRADDRPRGKMTVHSPTTDASRPGSLVASGAGDALRVRRDPAQGAPRPRDGGATERAARPTPRCPSRLPVGRGRRTAGTESGVRTRTELVRPSLRSCGGTRGEPGLVRRHENRNDSVAPCYRLEGLGDQPARARIRTGSAHGTD